MRPIVYVAIAAFTLLCIAVIILAILLTIFVEKYNTLNEVYPPPLQGLDFIINTTWDSRPLTHPDITISLRWNEYNKAINVDFKAPLFRNPPKPDHTAGVTPMLWNYEVFEIFFLNSKNQYLEVELGPYNQWLVLMLNGTRQTFNTGENLQLSVWNQFENDTWKGQAEIPLAYLPPNVTLINAYKIHQEVSSKVYEALSPAANGAYEKPDFHRLELFRPIVPTKIIPKEYFSEKKAYRDNRYDDFWAGI